MARDVVVPALLAKASCVHYLEVDAHIDWVERQPQRENIRLSRRQGRQSTDHDEKRREARFVQHERLSIRADSCPQIGLARRVEFPTELFADLQRQKHIRVSTGTGVLIGRHVIVVVVAVIFI